MASYTVHVDLGVADMDMVIVMHGADAAVGANFWLSGVGIVEDCDTSPGFVAGSGNGIGLV